jgi:dTDP-4-dehydrorhamnose 3,5-epimerase
MPVQKSSIQGLLILRWDGLEDSRGFFKHTFQMNELAAALGREPSLRQGNHSRSKPGVLRGFHTENWDKLIYVVRGSALCVVADVRPESPSFGQTESLRLGDPPGEFAALFVSQGLSNAFYCYEETDYLNQVSMEFDPRHRGGVAWNDPTLAVRWPTTTPLLSPKDAAQPTLKELFPDHARFR